MREEEEREDEGDKEDKEDKEDEFFFLFSVMGEEPFFVARFADSGNVDVVVVKLVVDVVV